MSVNRMVYAGTSYFGENARKEIITEIEKRHFKKCYLISDECLEGCGIVLKVETVLKEHNVPYIINNNVKPNPTIENVLYGLKIYQTSGCDFILAVGGGSVIDTAKAISVIANNPDNTDVVSLEGMDKSKNPAVPVIAVPTTAGTGSETTMDFVITNTAERRKMACMDSKAVPVAAILDTDIMSSLPAKLTAATAMDALTHAIESYISLGAFSFSETLSLKAVSLISENLPAALKDPVDLEARKQLAIAQYMAGMSFTNVGLGIVHSMAHPLSAFYDIPHGAANALILPYVLRFNSQACPEKMVMLAAAFAPEFDKSKGAMEATNLCVKKIIGLNKAAGLPQKLSELNVKPGDIKALSKSALCDASTPDNPRPVNVEIIESLYMEMF